MSAEAIATVAERAEAEFHASKRRAKISQGTHYVLGIGAAAAAAAAGVLATSGSPKLLAAAVGAIGALFASIQTFMVPLKRASFHYGQMADYEQLAIEAKAKSASDDERQAEELLNKLSELRHRTAKDLAP
jgi:hypothetical protein